MVAIYLEHVGNESPNKYNKQIPIVLIQMSSNPTITTTNNPTIIITNNTTITITSKPTTTTTNKNPIIIIIINNHNIPLALPQMIAIRILTIVYSHLMGHMKMVVALPGYKKEDHVVEEWALNIKHNVILHVNVDMLADLLVVEPVKNESQNKFNKHIPQTNKQITIVLIQMYSKQIPQIDHINYKLAVPALRIVMEIIIIAYFPPMDPLTAAFAFLGN
jgi:hypothetical protein